MEDSPSQCEAVLLPQQYLCHSSSISTFPSFLILNLTVLHPHLLFYYMSFWSRAARQQSMHAGGEQYFNGAFPCVSGVHGSCKFCFAWFFWQPLFYLYFETKPKIIQCTYLVLNGKILRQRMHGFFSLRKNCVKISKYATIASRYPYTTT